MDDDPPEYSIVELLLGGLLIAMAAAFFIYAGDRYFAGRPYDAMEAAGLGLVLLANCADPRSFAAHWAVVLSKPIGSAGRDTLLTVGAGLVGALIFLAGWGLNWYAGHVG